jgi:hypothetical protein
VVILEYVLPTHEILTKTRPILHGIEYRHDRYKHVGSPYERPCHNAEETFRFRGATTTQAHNARSMHCNSNLTVEPNLISRALDIQNKYPPCVQICRSLEAASLPHSAVPPRAASGCSSSTTSGPIPQTALQNTASSTADRTLTPRFTMSSKSQSCRIVYPVNRRAFVLRRASRMWLGAGSGSGLR